ncbi:magnesium transporter CorA family protein [Calidifontibacter sp. DB0510]|uniref:Magnesium transporter CorA family protein n=2 Tax=Metallococcus carri TaxID=1656884 RepID=A0A967B2Z9_9MICO|nr:magnesium transporter CorA family protein [Metallococcus carri]NOP37047.1 magnesium transporter CorA family protein [Calidifontibacter sp. DB2511S]
MHCRVWKNGKLIGTEVARDKILDALRDPDHLVWLDLVEATAEEFAWIAEAFQLAPTEIEDITAPHERPKVTRRGTHLFFTTYSATVVDGELRMRRISGFVLPQGMVTVRQADFPIEAALRTWEENADLLAHGPRALVHGLMDSVVDGHFETIQTFDDRVEALDDVLFERERTGPDFLREIYGLRRDLVSLRRVVLPMREVVNALVRHGGRTDPDLDPWFDDLYDHVLRAGEWTDSLRDLVSSIFETNLSLQDARLNMIMRQLAAWAAIIAVPTAITGWFGQNVPYPGFSQTWGFWASVLLIVAGSAGLYWAFRRRGWV